MKLVFKENSIGFGQDFSWHNGIPEDVIFEESVSTIFKRNEGLWLKAANFGGQPYGNGKIVVRRKELLENMDKVVFVEGSREELEVGPMGKYEEREAEYIAGQIVNTVESEDLDKFIQLVLEQVCKKREE